MEPACPRPASGHGRVRRLLLVALVVAMAGLPPAVARSIPIDQRVAARSAAPAGQRVAAAAALPTAPPGVALPAAPPSAPAQDPATGRVPALWMPAAGAVVRGFELPAGAYGPGHRGVDIAVPVGERARAPTAGRVVFAGPVAGTTWASLEVAPGVLVTLGPLLGPAVASGSQVRTGAPLGRVAPGHGPADLAAGAPPRGGAPPDPPAGVPPAGGGPPDPAARAPAGGGPATLHLGVRVDRVYVDPLPYLVDRPRPRLAPLAAPGGLARS